MCVCVCVFSLYDAVLVVVFHKLVMCLRWIYIDVESFDGMVRKKRQVMCVCVLCVYFPYLEMMFVCMLWIKRKRRLATTTPSPPPKKTR